MADAQVVTLQKADSPSLSPVASRDDFERLKQQRALLKEFISSELVEGIDHDYAQIPGTPKKSLLKPGAEKLKMLFSLGVKFDLLESKIDRSSNYAEISYRATVYSLRNPDVTIADCEGLVSSQEKKYKERAKYDYNGGSRKFLGYEPTPISDILNTLTKMAQKRAFVGAIILAVAASDFFSQDIEDAADAEAIGAAGRAKPNKTKVNVPKTTSATSQSQGDSRAPTGPVIVKPASAPAPTPGSFEETPSRVFEEAPPRWKDKGTAVNAILDLGKAFQIQPKDITAFARSIVNKSPNDATLPELERVYDELVAKGRSK